MPISNNNRYIAPDWNTQKINAAELNAIDSSVGAATIPVGQIVLSRREPGAQYLPCDGKVVDFNQYPDMENVDLPEVAGPTGELSDGTPPISNADYTINDLVWNNGNWLCTVNKSRPRGRYKAYPAYYAYSSTSLSGPWTQEFVVTNPSTATYSYCFVSDAKFLNGYWVAVGCNHYSSSSGIAAKSRGQVSYSLAAADGSPTSWTQENWTWGPRLSSSYADNILAGVEYDTSRGIWQLCGYEKVDSDGYPGRGGHPYLLTGTSAAPTNLTATLLSSGDGTLGGLKYYNGITVIAGWEDASRYVDFVDDDYAVIFVVSGNAGSVVELRLHGSASGVNVGRWTMVECYNGTWVVASDYFASGKSNQILVSNDPLSGWDTISSPFGTFTTATYWHSLKCISGWWMISDSLGNVYYTQDPRGLWETRSVLSSADVAAGGAVVAIGGYPPEGAAGGQIVYAASRAPENYSDSYTATPDIYYTTATQKSAPTITTMFGVSLPPDTSAYIKAVSDTAYAKKTWVNNSSPYINATNLNALTGATSTRQAVHDDVRLFVNQAPVVADATWVAVAPVPPDELGVTFCTLAEDEEVN